MATKKQKQAEVVNGYVYYRSKVEVSEAFREAIAQGRIKSAVIEGEERFMLWDEDGNIITHPGNDTDEVELPDGPGYIEPDPDACDEAFGEKLRAAETAKIKQVN
jgi:hypothetical protein